MVVRKVRCFFCSPLFSVTPVTLSEYVCSVSRQQDLVQRLAGSGGVFCAFLISVFSMLSLRLRSHSLSCGHPLSSSLRLGTSVPDNFRLCLLLFLLMVKSIGRRMKVALSLLPLAIPPSCFFFCCDRPVLRFVLLPPRHLVCGHCVFTAASQRFATSSHSWFSMSMFPTCTSSTPSASNCFMTSISSDLMDFWRLLPLLVSWESVWCARPSDTGERTARKDCARSVTRSATPVPTSVERP